jgi:hypothetical protein
MAEFFKTLLGSFAGPLLLSFGLGLMLFTFNLLNVDLIPILSFIVASSPVWLPVSLFFITYERWVDAVQLKFQDTQGRVTLRIKPPQDVFKSPEAMESVLTHIFNPNPADNIAQTYIDGKFPLTSSLEIVSTGGEVRFYANVPKKKVKNALEAQLYAQYPGIEITEEPIDYTAEVKNDLNIHDWMSFHITKKKDQVLPIRTYIDMGLDKMPKEEEKFEPMAALIEHLSKAKLHERIWVQILITPHVERDFKTGTLSKSGTWVSDAKATIDKMMGRESPGNFEDPNMQSKLTMGERDTIAAIERNISKFAYEVVIRAMYITMDKTKFDGDMIGGLLRSFSQFEYIGRNGFGLRWRTDFNYNFLSDPKGTKKKYYKKRELDYYKGRNFVPVFNKSELLGPDNNPKVMSVEELATIYHIPGKSIITPSMTRVESIRRNAPSNLPIGSVDDIWS